MHVRALSFPRGVLRYRRRVDRTEHARKSGSEICKWADSLKERSSVETLLAFPLAVANAEVIGAMHSHDIAKKEMCRARGVHLEGAC